VQQKKMWGACQLDEYEPGVCPGGQGGQQHCGLYQT